MYDTDILEIDESKLYKADLLRRLPPFFRNVKEFKVLNDILSYELGILNLKAEDILNQFFVNTATWGLSSIWEKPLGIETNLNNPYEVRREIIKAKLRGAGTITKTMIKSVAESFSNGQVDVIEDPANYSFIVKFIGTLGIPPNMNGLVKAIEDIKPAHLAYSFEYTYLTWDQFDNYNKTFNEWDTLNLTWDEFEIYKEVI